jgi:hypothetical protein
VTATDFERFHTVELPNRLAARDGGAVASAYVGAGRALTLQTPDGAAFTYRAVDGDVVIEPGAAAPVVVEVDADAFADLAAERWSIYGLLYPGRLRIVQGSLPELEPWEPVLQNLWFDRPIYDDAVAHSLRDRDGAPLDISRSFTMDDDDDAIAHFLEVAGFVVLRGVFTPDEITGLDGEVTRLVGLATPGDRKSWWAKTADGREVCCRVTYCGQRSPALLALADDSRLTRAASWAGTPLRAVTDRLDGISVVLKHPDIVSGLSDLPWHRDCGMGGHPVLCPTLNIGIQLDRADAANGQLVFLAGSHHHTNSLTDADAHSEWPVVRVEADPGDVTVHFGHAQHAAPPPLSPEANRRALYVGFVPPAIFDVIGPGQGYNDVVYESGGDVQPPSALTA